MIDDISKLKMREALKRIDEGCVGGVCSVGSGGKSSSTGSNAGGKTVSSMQGIGSRASHWVSEEAEAETDKLNVLPEEADTNYIEQEEGQPFTAEEKREDDWTSKELKFESNVRDDSEGLGHQLGDLKDRYARMMEGMQGQNLPVQEPEYDQLAAPVQEPTDVNQVEVDPAHQTASDLGAESEAETLKAVTDQFDANGTAYEVMINVDGSSKSAQEWAAEMDLDASEELDPAIPDLAPTEGGAAPEDLDSIDAVMIAFPEIEPQEM
jgi:hypothetical protein